MSAGKLFRDGSFYRALAILGLIGLCLSSLQGCASSNAAGKKSTHAETGKANSPAVAVKVEEGSDLRDISKGLKTSEDQIVLDLLMGYRMLLLQNQNPKALDKETLKKSRRAFDQLETLLRHGGIRPQDGGERVYKVTSEDRLSLLEVLQSASEAANKNVKEGEWDKARARWKEMVQSKPSITFILEEAQWGLTLTDALQSTLPDSIKKSLKEVNESYAAEINHDEIGKQVRALLVDIKDVKLQRELKKLANRSWEKDKRAGRGSLNPVVQTEPPELAGSASDTSKPTSGSTSQIGTPTMGQTATLTAEANSIGAQADTLVSQGKYVAAFKILEKAGDQVWVREKKTQIGDRFCEEKRKSAANSFKDFKKAGADSIKRVHLKRTAADLDSCLFYFPELSISQKVRKNREMVESELKNLKP